MRHRHGHGDRRQSASLGARCCLFGCVLGAAHARPQRRQCAGSGCTPCRHRSRQGLPEDVSRHALRGRPPRPAHSQALVTDAEGRASGMTLKQTRLPSGDDAPSLRHFFDDALATADPEVSGAIQRELRRQQSQIELIASENIVSRAVLAAQGSVLTNKYAEGLPGKRYYGGCEFVDQAEQLAIDRAKQLFACGFVNVQPHSGAQANQAVFMALLNPGDTILGLSIAAGGHLTHGAPPNLSGKWFKAVQYGVRREDALIDFDEVERLAPETRPRLVIAGGSAYPRIIDFARFRRIADAVGAYFMVDMAHFARPLA